MLLGCNPKVKNIEGLITKKIADQCKAKDAKKNIRKAEKGYNDMNANLRPGRYGIAFIITPNFLNI